MSYPSYRSINPDEYKYYRDQGIGSALEAAGLAVTDAQKQALARNYEVTTDSSGAPHFRLTALNDEIYVDLWQSRIEWALEPFNFAKAADWRLLQEGYYVPRGRIFPMGDNHDNSRDARYFGTVSLDKVLGKGLFPVLGLSRGSASSGKEG